MMIKKTKMVKLKHLKVELSVYHKYLTKLDKSIVYLRAIKSLKIIIIHATTLEQKGVRFDYSKGHNPAFIIWGGVINKQYTSHTVTMDYLQGFLVLPVVWRVMESLNICLRYIFSSTVPQVMRRQMTTFLSCPILNTRSTA